MPKLSIFHTSLARSILIYEWKKCLAAIVTVTTAIIITVLQTGFLLGMAKNAMYILDNSDADIWITSPKLESFDYASDVGIKYALPPLIHPNVKKVETIKNGHVFFNINGNSRFAEIWGFDISQNSITFPKNIEGYKMSRLGEQLAVILDKKTANNWGLKVGDSFKVNKFKVKLVETADLNNSEVANIFASKETAKMISGTKNENTKYIALKLFDKIKDSQTKQDLVDINYQPKYQVWLQNELKQLTFDYWIYNSSNGPVYWAITIVGICVAFIITNQMLKMLVLNNLKEFGSLRAMGVTRRSLIYIVFEQCFWIAVISCFISFFGIYFCGVAARNNNIPLDFPNKLIISSYVGVFLLCIISGTFSLRALYKFEPADLLR